MVNEAKVWETILARPLDSPPPSYIFPLPSEVEEHFSCIYAMDFDHFQDKPWRDQYLGELIPTKIREPRASRKRRISTSNNNCAMAFDHLQDKPRRDQYLEGFILKENWSSRGPRASRKRRIYTLNRRKWDQQAMSELVKGVKKYGLGPWTKVKRHFFFPSFREPELFREPTQLKDKWRNLLIACRILPNSKGKEQMEMYFDLGPRLKKRIQRLAKRFRLGIYK